jgi:hypothetical protein
VTVNQILPDAHRVAAALQLQRDQLAVGFTGAGRKLAVLRRSRGLGVEVSY